MYKSKKKHISNKKKYKNIKKIKMRKKVKIMVVLCITTIAISIFNNCKKDVYQNNDKKDNVETQKHIEFDIDFTEIRMENGMLIFNSWEHYYSVIESLINECENYTNDFFENLNVELGGDADEDVLNDSASAREFDQFYPLHVFCDMFEFYSMFCELELQEKQWMDMENPSIDDNPFKNSCFERYQSALHNINGEVIIGGEIFNPLDQEQKVICVTKGYAYADHYFIHNNHTKVIDGKLSSSKTQTNGATTLWRYNDNNKLKRWYSSITTQVGGYKGLNCDGSNRYYIGSKSSSLSWGFYKATYVYPKEKETYIVGGLVSFHKATAPNPYEVLTLNL